MPAPKPAADSAEPDQRPFWKRKRLSEMTQAEWESLCDGCGRCCLNKLMEEGSDKTFYTDVACRLLDADACRCTDYKNRSAKVKDCVTLTWRNIGRITWLPPTCGYVLVARGLDLAWWHPLVSGDPETVHTSGVSVRGKVGASEADVPDDKLEEHLVSWPLKWPKGAKEKA
ncbi:MAG: YcgN family cysteine cluster protein [Alphaproteobacteria bacterium]|nr:YcgN family cysteine cluster protein [Alphaproteobacteria bacterium]